KFRDIKSELKGRDLQVLGIEPGPVYRQILDELLDARLNGKVHSRQDEIDYVLRYLSAPGRVRRAPSMKRTGG
ncbi:MAG TPA: hypothetical protein DCE18_14195, partial [Syntrophobacteraceae bacterium]|nr:hypothetical protein [Syntrophobacteraceae bacterium]